MSPHRFMTQTSRALTPDQFLQSGDVTPPLLGDVNLDGTVNGLDVDPFTDALLGGTYQTEADMNEDGLVNGLDVDPFVVAVVGGGFEAVPEPATWLLAALGLIGALGAGLLTSSQSRPKVSP